MRGEEGQRGEGGRERGEAERESGEWCGEGERERASDVSVVLPFCIFGCVSSGD